MVLFHLKQVNVGLSDTFYVFFSAALIDKPGLDVLGQAPTKKNYECVCPSCQRHLAASRFAPHLEKCMGMGRNSSRIASRRCGHNFCFNSLQNGCPSTLTAFDCDWSGYHTLSLPLFLFI